jgi:hypothetical protein
MKTRLISLILICFMFSSCDQPGKTDYSVSGKAQKGPFMQGSAVTLFELDDDLRQTGNSFLSTTTSDDGSFNFPNVALKNSFALIDVNGFYFNEIFGESSPAPISLQGIAEVSDEQEVNVNVMTHIIRKRLETLVSEGQSFQDAKSQAESELLMLLGVSESIDDEFEAFDISREEDQNAILLSLSLMVQKTLRSNSGKASLPALLTSFLSTFSTDFGDDGRVEQTVIDELNLNISNLNLIDIRNNIEDKYEGIGVEASIPDFEEYLAIFQQKYSDSIYTSFVYPEMASPDPIDSPDAKVPNILVRQNSEFIPNPYTMAAIIPLRSSLTINFIMHPGSSEYGFTIGMHNTGWEVINNYPNGITLHSQRQNEIMAILVDLSDWGTADIEYYEDGEDTPSYTKTISWGVVEE